MDANEFWMLTLARLVLNEVAELEADLWLCFFGCNVPVAGGGGGGVVNPPRPRAGGV